MTEQQAEQYKILNSLDATTDLRDIIDYFFEEHKNRYKYNTAYQKYRKDILNKTFTPTKKLYDVIANTSLVEDRHVITTKSRRSNFYHIRKAYLANIDRDKRTKRREDERNNVTQIRTSDDMDLKDPPRYSHDNNQYGEFGTQEDEESEIISLNTPKGIKEKNEDDSIIDSAEGRPIKP